LAIFVVAMLFNSVLNNRNVLVNNGKLSALFTKHHHYTLKSGDYLQSKNGKFVMKMEHNCNLVVHAKHHGKVHGKHHQKHGKHHDKHGKHHAKHHGKHHVKHHGKHHGKHHLHGKALFATNTGGKGTHCRAIVEKNGNFVIKSKAGHVVWGTNTIAKQSGPYKLIMKNHGNLILFHKKSCVWASKSCPLPGKLKGLKGKKALKKMKKQLKKKLKKNEKTSFQSSRKRQN